MESIVIAGSEQMRDVAADTLRAVRRAMGIDRTMRRFARKARAR